MHQIEEGRIVIDPIEFDMLNPNSVNLTLAPELKVYTADVLDCKAKNPTKIEIIPPSGFQLHPGELYLGATVERTETHGFVPMLEGRSSLARLGLFVHVSAGVGDLSFKGTWTCELYAVKPLVIYPNMKIAQIIYHTVEGRVDDVYNGKYMNQILPTESRLFQELK